MATAFWQAKIWGLLHDPALKALHNNTGRGGNSFWQQLEVMQDWGDYDPENSGGKAWKHIHLADLLASASDRGAIGSLSSSIDYGLENGLQLFHLLSGEPLNFRLQPRYHQQIIGQRRAAILKEIEETLLNVEIEDPKDGSQIKFLHAIQDEKTVFWWLWRCLPQAICQSMGDDEQLLLMPAETRIPDASIWSHTSLTAALAGALAGYDLTQDALKHWPNKQEPSRAYLAIFSFTPVQELIKASRKMRDLWAGSWLLHYLSAKVCWTLAQKYGPDSFIYPNLFQQPLIDAWLLKRYSTFKQWIQPPDAQQLLTAGFPNVIVLVLPEAKVSAAMQLAKQTLYDEWLKIGGEVLDELQQRQWMPTLRQDSFTWDRWLKGQWQTYWSAVPIGDRTSELTSSELYKNDGSSNEWRTQQNEAYQLNDKQALFAEQELTFLQQAAHLRRQRYGKYPFNANVGSWWPYMFDQLRRSLAATKNARSWEIPTAFSSRSSISGFGATVHNSSNPWIKEGELQKLWAHHAGVFDGRERLNATEVLKRGLHLALPKLLPVPLDCGDIDTAYPDLTAGVAGYLKTCSQDQDYFQQVCQAIRSILNEQSSKVQLPNGWGIPWIDRQIAEKQSDHSRLLSPSWLVEDVSNPTIEQLETQIEKEKDEVIAQQYCQELLEQRRILRQALQATVDHYYPSNNPSDWYVLAAGDGDSMSKWLQGTRLKQYAEYVPQELQQKVAQQDPDLADSFQTFLNQKKRMGPSTHNALSRALLDFSNHLVPYLTEQRYAGRLIYSGGDDVLAYSNLWEWDAWLWDIRQCFRGDKDSEFDNAGHYWRWAKGEPPSHLSQRPLFTMGADATISFGVTIANQGVPLAIALENLWEAEAEAKQHFCSTLEKGKRKKNAVQVRVLYGNGNILKATAKFEAFDTWRSLLKAIPDLKPSLFEQAAEVWKQHPLPSKEAIPAWVRAFCSQREVLKTDADAVTFGQALEIFLITLWDNTESDDRDLEIGYWLKLAAFMLRKREIQLGGHR